MRQLCLAVGLADLLLRALDLGDVGVHGDGPALRRLALVDLNPAAVAAALDVGTRRLLVLRQPLGHPFVDTPVCVLDEAALRRVADQLGVRRAWGRRAHAGIEQLAVGPVADDQPILGVIEREPFRDRLDRVSQPLLAAVERDLGLIAGGDIAPGAHHLDRLPVLVADQVLLVVDPAVAAVLAQEPVLDGGGPCGTGAPPRPPPPPTRPGARSAARSPGSRDTRPARSPASPGCSG